MTQTWEQVKEVETVIERLDGDNPPLTKWSQHMAAWQQVRATLRLIEEVEKLNQHLDGTMSFGPISRIAAALEAKLGL